MPARKKITKKTVRKVVKKTVKKEAVMPREETVSSVETNSGQLTDNYLYSWEAPEFLYHEKPAWWHFAAYGSILVMIALMIILKEWFAIPVFLLIAVLVYQYAEVKPKNISIIITSLGIIIGERFYPYNEIKSFWIIFNPPTETLNLELTRRFSPVITIQLEGNDPNLIKEILREHLLEESDRKEDIIERLTKFIRF